MTDPRPHSHQANASSEIAKAIPMPYNATLIAVPFKMTASERLPKSGVDSSGRFALASGSGPGGRYALAMLSLGF